VAKNLSKGTDVIIYKEGKGKTVEYGLLKNIPIVNPLWLHDSLTQNQLLQKDNYLIKKTYTEMLNEKVLSSNASSTTNSMGNKAQKTGKRKSDEVSEKDKKQKVIKTEKTEDGKKFIDLNKFSEEIAKNKAITEKAKEGGTPNKKDTILNEENKENNNKKITTFFEKKEPVKPKDPPNRVKSPEDYSDRLHICSYCLDDGHKKLIKSVTGKFEKYVLNKIAITSIDKLKEYSYIVTTETYRKNDLKIIYAILNNIKLLNLTYFEQAEKDKKYPTNIENFIIKYPIDISKPTDNKPLSRYKIYLHDSLSGTRPILLEVTKLLGGDISEHLRLSDICVVNKYEVDAIPSSVKLLNQDFLVDCILNNKLMDMENMKYLPERVVKKK
jgi:hypothetical protein